MRKFQPLGTKFKNIVWGTSRLMLWLNIQEGKDRMRKKEFIRLGATTTCVKRGFKDISSSCSYIEEHEDNIDETEQPEGEERKRLYLTKS